MAGGDYFSCTVCGRKTFYDSDVDYEYSSVGEMASLCKECSKTLRIAVVNIDTGREIRVETFKPERPTEG